MNLRIRNPRAPLSRALDPPARAIPNQGRLATFSPPAIHVARKSHPAASRLAEAGHLVQEDPVRLLCRRNAEVIGVDEEAEQAMPGHHRFDLTFPDPIREIFQDMEQ